MRIIKIKNAKTASDVWVGQTIEPDEYFSIPSQTLINWQENTKVFDNVASKELVVNNGDIDFTNELEGWDWILGNKREVLLDTPKDNEDRPLFKQVVTQPSWHYSPRSLDFWTSKYNSLYNRKHNAALIDNGTDYGDGSLSFFDNTDTELIKGESESDVDFQTRLTSNCIKTICYFEPQVAFDVFGAKLMVKNPPTERSYLWVIAAPDVPEEYGGCIDFMGGGMNLSFFPNCQSVHFDAKTGKVVEPDPLYHSGKVAVVIKHAVGAQIGIQFILEFYSA